MFNNAVVCLQGGSVFSPAVVMSTSKAQAQTASLARELGCSAADTTQILTCLRSKPAQSINAAQTKVQWVTFVKKKHKKVKKRSLFLFNVLLVCLCVVVSCEWSPAGLVTSGWWNCSSGKAFCGSSFRTLPQSRFTSGLISWRRPYQQSQEHQGQDTDI